MSGTVYSETGGKSAVSTETLVEPSEREEADAARDIIAQFEAKLRSIVGNTINVARDARRLERKTRHKRLFVSEDDLLYGGPGEKLLAGHLASLTPREIRALHALAAFGRGRSKPSALTVFERLNAREISSSPFAIELVEAWRTLAHDLTKGYHRARRRDELRRLGVTVDESGAASRALAVEDAEAGERRFDEEEEADRRAREGC